MKTECLESYETKMDNLNDTGGEITFKNWDIKNAEEIVLDELKEIYDGDYNILDFKITEKLEHAYSCSRFLEEQDAWDNGFTYWLEYHKEWKKGLGKCTTFYISYKLEKQGSEKQI